MMECFRWYGETLDKITLPEIIQTGATGIVTALHDVPYEEVWPRHDIAARKARIEAEGLGWAVVESLPLHEDIKRGTGNLAPLFANYRQSMANLAAEGITTICYNFMPLLDWTRTDLRSPNGTGGTCLRFEATRMAAFEIHMVGRTEAEADYDARLRARADEWFASSTAADRDELLASIMSGMTGAVDRYDMAGLRKALAGYSGMTRSDLRGNFKRFLDEVIPAAEDLGLRMCVHPDDPPRDILGLPRIVSTAADIDWILGAQDIVQNGLTLCSGSLGAHPGNDVAAIAEAYAPRIHFVHLRNVHKDADGSFEEAAHLDGDTDMVALARILLDEEDRRRRVGRADHDLPFRPDHGHDILADLRAGYIPGYPLIGRLRGLAELRGVLHALRARERGVSGAPTG